MEVELNPPTSVILPNNDEDDESWTPPNGLFAKILNRLVRPPKSLGLGLHFGGGRPRGVTVYSCPFIYSVTDARGTFALAASAFISHYDELFDDPCDNLLEVEVSSSKDNNTFYGYVDLLVDEFKKLVSDHGGSWAKTTLVARLRDTWKHGVRVLEDCLQDVPVCGTKAMVVIVVRKYHRALWANRNMHAVYEVLVFKPRLAALSVFPVVCGYTNKRRRGVDEGPMRSPFKPYTFEFIQKQDLERRGEKVWTVKLEDTSGDDIIPIVTSMDDGDETACWNILECMTRSGLVFERGRVDDALLASFHLERQVAPVQGTRRAGPVE